MAHWKTEAIIVAIGMAVLGGQIKQGINKFVEKDRVVTVKGLAEMEVPADKVTWPLVYKEVGNDLITLYDKIKTTNQTIVDFLKGKGIDEDEIAPRRNKRRQHRVHDNRLCHRQNDFPKDNRLACAVQDRRLLHCLRYGIEKAFTNIIRQRRAT